MFRAALQLPYSGKMSGLNHLEYCDCFLGGLSLAAQQCTAT